LARLPRCLGGHEVRSRTGGSRPDRESLRCRTNDCWPVRAATALGAKGRPFKLCAEGQLLRIPGERKLAKAACHGPSCWSSFELFLGDGRLGIDNNPAERAVRPIGIGHRYRLFAGCDSSRETLALAMTLIETVEMSGLDSQAWLADVLDFITDHKVNRLN